MLNTPAHPHVPAQQNHINMSNEIQSQQSQAIAIVAKSENIEVIVRDAPANYRLNQTSTDNCLRFGQTLLDEVNNRAARGLGLTDELDQRLASFIEKSRKTLKVMNERRAPVTKLFDQIRKEYTTLENAIDPAKKDTIPYLLQLARNGYAAKKREEEEARRRAEAVAAALVQAKQTYRVDVEQDLRQTFNALVVQQLNELGEMFASVTLENYNGVVDTVTGVSVDLPAEWCPSSHAIIPLNLSPEDSKAIRASVIKSLMPQFEEQYRTEVGDYRQEILDKLPSKKKELEKVAAASAEEAERLRKELAEKEAIEAARREEDRRAKEAEEKRKAELDAANAEMAGLFAGQKAEVQTYQPKAKVSQKIVVNAPEGFLNIIQMWWMREGCTLTIEELQKIFKKQVSFCEKLANKEGVFVDSPAVNYVEDVKAQ